jgi:hypothetical protein
VRSITDFGELPVFATAATFPMIFISQKSSKISNLPIFTQVKSLEEPYPDVLAIIKKTGQNLPKDAIKGANWLLTDASSANRLQKMAAAGIPLGEYVNKKIYVGIKTGLNKAFWIDDAKRAELIAKDPKSAEIIKPLAVGDDVRKWHIRNKDKYLIFTPIGINIKRYPAIFEHLNQWKPELEKRYDKGKFYWELRACDYYAEFEKPKIVYPEIAKESRFAFDNKSLLFNNRNILNQFVLL